MKKKRSDRAKRNDPGRGQPAGGTAKQAGPIRSARTLGAPVGAAAAVAGKHLDASSGANLLHHEPTNALANEAGNALAHHATDSAATEVVAAATAAGAGVIAGTSAGGAAAAGLAGAGVAGAGAAGAAGAGAAGAAGAAAAGTGGAASGAAAAGAGQAAQTAAIGAVAVAAVATVVVVVVVTGDEPEVAEPAPTTTTTVVAAPTVERPIPVPAAFETAATAAFDTNLLAGVDQETEAGPLIIAGLQGEPTNVGVPITLASGATLTIDPIGNLQYLPSESFIAIPAGETIVDEFTYIVTNASGFTEEWSGSITVLGENDAPVVDEPSAVSLKEKATSSVALVATDPDGDALAFSLDEGAPAFVSLIDGGDGTAQLSIAPPDGSAGAYDVAVTVSDAVEPPLSESMTVRVTVEAVEETPTRVTESLVARYDFAEASGASIADSSGGGSAPVLTVANPDAVTWNGGSLTVTAPTLISSNGPATALNDAIKATNEFTVEAWITAANATQAGPARVVSISSGVGDRNVTLGQGEPDGIGGDHWSSRQRSTETSSNGLPAISTPAGSAVQDGLTHVVVTRSPAGEVQLYVDGSVVASTTVGGDLSNWSSSFPLLLANETSLDRPWLGTFHLVAVYSRALSAAEVNQNLQVGS